MGKHASGIQEAPLPLQAAQPKQWNLGGMLQFLLYADSMMDKRDFEIKGNFGKKHKFFRDFTSTGIRKKSDFMPFSQEGATMATGLAFAVPWRSCFEWLSIAYIYIFIHCIYIYICHDMAHVISMNQNTKLKTCKCNDDSYPSYVVASFSTVIQSIKGNPGIACRWRS